MGPKNFKDYLLGHRFTVQTDHRARMSILKERTSKIHKSRLTRWLDRLITFNFNIEHIAGTKMGLADLKSRNPSEPAKPPNEYDENFIIAAIDIIRETLNIIRKRGRPRKQQNQQSINKKVETSSNSTTNKNSTRESHDDSKRTTISDKYKQQRGTPRKATKELQHDYKKSQDISQKHGTKTIKRNTDSNYNLRSAQNANKTEFNTTIYDVRTNRQIALNTSAFAI